MSNKSITSIQKVVNDIHSVTPSHAVTVASLRKYHTIYGAENWRQSNE